MWWGERRFLPLGFIENIILKCIPWRWGPAGGAPMHKVLKYLHTSNPIHCSSLHGQLSAGGGGARWGGRGDGKEVCVWFSTYVWTYVGVWLSGAGLTSPLQSLRLETATNPLPHHPAWPSQATPPPISLSAPSPGLNLRGHLPLLMKIHVFISISGVISDTAKHKTCLFPQRPGEPDRMTPLSALAERDSCRAWKWDLVEGSEVGGLDGENLMFGLATMAAVCYLSSSLWLMRLSVEMEENRRGSEEVEKRRTQKECTTHLPHTPLSPPLLIYANSWEQTP